MKGLLTALAFCLLFAQAAWAGQTGCESRASDCCHQIIDACPKAICMKCVPPPCHKFVTPCDPCIDYCLPSACHKFVTPLDPCVERCLPCVCHKPATPCNPCLELCPPCHKPACPVKVECGSDCRQCGKGCEDRHAKCGGCKKSSQCDASGWED